MFCPNCGHENIHHETSFCSRCGFLLTGTLNLLRTGGTLPDSPVPKGKSPRNRGLKQGLFIFLLTFLVVPIVAVITAALKGEPWGVVIAAILFFVGGLLRMAYALMFESNEAENLSRGDVYENVKDFPRPQNANMLPPQQSTHTNSFVPAGSWRDTNELQQAGSVTERTSRLLEKDR